MPHHRPCYCTDVTKIPLLSVNIVTVILISLDDTSQKKRYIHVDMWEVFKDSLL